MPATRQPYKKVVLDTGPLLDALTLEFIEREPRAEFMRSSLLPYLGDPTSQRSFRDLLRSIEEILITSHVVGEIKREGHVPNNLSAAYWESSMAFFRERKISERLITLEELDQDEWLRQIVRRYGPTDASLVALARREGCVLLTGDGRLYQFLSPDFDIKLVEHLLE